MKKSTKSGIIVFAAITLLSIGTIVVNTLVSNKRGRIYSSGVTENSKRLEGRRRHFGKEYVAALYIEGTIEEGNRTYNQEWLMSTIRSLKEDRKNLAIAIYIDSPGGGVYQADEVYLALEDYKTTGRPIYVYQGPMAASGGYYISCAGNKIYANRNTLTGCIGVIFGQSYDMTELMDKLGIKTETIHSGRNKLMFGLNQPVTDEQRKIQQAMCDECYDQFVGIVAKGRGLSLNTARDLSDGRLYTAKQGLEAGLLDKVDSWENMIEDLCQDELDRPDAKVVHYSYERNQTFMERMMGVTSRIGNAAVAAKLGLPVAAIEEMAFNSYPAYLYQK